ncbi:MAG: hypothetical protein KDD29_00865 [Flavobacteriales bacterium]|nr:hypothetical protein [Flavobacteriales bacterium]MCB9335437.1 hypothetical protein [Flavobacteriales bacterium]
MEIQQLRKEFNELLAKINQHSERFTCEDHLPSLEVSVLISKVQKLQEVAIVLKYSIEQKEENLIQRRNLQSTKNEIVEEKLEEKVEAVVEEEPVTIMEDKVELVEEKLQENEVVTEMKEPVIEVAKNSVGDKFLQTPIASLKDAFSLNDRYLLANELFEKDMALFTNLIKNIDECNNLQEAMNIFEKTYSELSWDEENEYVQSLQNKVQRRFM